MMESVESVESKEFMDRIQQDLASHDVPTIENALEQLADLTFPKGSPYALPIMRRILDMLEREVVTVSWVVVIALRAVGAGLENPEIIKFMDRVLVWRNDRFDVLWELIRSFSPTDSAAEYMISRLHLMRPLQDSTIMESMHLISQKFCDHLTPSQIDEFLAYILMPEALNAPPGPDGTIDYLFGPFNQNTQAHRAFFAVNNLIGDLSSANWKAIGNCFFQLNYTPVEIVPLLYDEQPPQGVDVDSLILACYEVAREYGPTNSASYEALRVLMRWQTEMDDRLVGKIAALIEGTLTADATNEDDIIQYFDVRDTSAALVDEVLRLQTGDLWNAPLLRGLFEPFRVGREIGYENQTELFGALMRYPDWPGEVLRQFRSEIMSSVFESFTSFPEEKGGAKAFWERFCREYPAPEMELLDTFSEGVQIGVAFSEEAERDGLDDSWEALETILGSRAYQAANPGPDSLFWQRLRTRIGPFLHSDDPEKRSRASAILAQNSA